MSERDAVVASYTAKLEGWYRTVDNLADDIASRDPRQREHHKATIQDISNHLQQLEKQVRVMNHSTRDAWRDLQAGVESNWQAFETAAKATLKRITGVAV